MAARPGRAGDGPSSATADTRPDSGSGPDDRGRRTPAVSAPSPSAPHRTAPAAGRVVRIVVADDHAAFRRGLVELLRAEDDLRVVAQATDIGGASRSVLEHRPDVLLLDLNMPGGSSLDAIPRILENAPGTAVVLVTMQDDPAFERRARALGASGYVRKDDADTTLAGVLQGVLRSRTAPEG